MQLEATPDACAHAHTHARTSRPQHSGKASASDSEFNAIRTEQRDAHDANLAPSLWVDKVPTPERETACARACALAIIGCSWRLCLGVCRHLLEAACVTCIPTWCLPRAYANTHVVHTQYAPNKLDDLMGNGDKRQQLRTWLAKWGSPSAASGAWPAATDLCVLAFTPHHVALSRHACLPRRVCFFPLCSFRACCCVWHSASTPPWPRVLQYLPCICAGYYSIQPSDGWADAQHTAMRVAGAKQGGSGGGKSDTIHKAVLMHGPPGIGKSSSARVVIESCGYTMVELNASDVRNKAGLQEKVTTVPPSPRSPPPRLSLPFWART